LALRKEQTREAVDTIFAYFVAGARAGGALVNVDVAKNAGVAVDA
jgi:hypothetical protein